MAETNLRLREYRPSDLQEFTRLFGDPQTMRYVGDGVALDLEAASELFEKAFDAYRNDPEFFIWAICENGEYAGHAELKRRKGRSEYELIYVLQRSRWGRSLGGEVVDRLLDEARKRGLSFVVATVDDENAASLAILRRRGFVPDPQLAAELECPAYRLDLGNRNPNEGSHGNVE